MFFFCNSMQVVPLTSDGALGLVVRPSSYNLPRNHAPVIIHSEEAAQVRALVISVKGLCP